MNRRDYIRNHARVSRQFEVKYFPRVRRALMAKVKATINALRSGGFDAARRYLHDDLSNTALASVVRSIYFQVGLRNARDNYSRQLHEKKGFGFNDVWTQFINNYLERFLLEKITFDVSASTRDALLRVLQKANIEGWSVAQTVEALTDWPYARRQAARIVRTEVNRAANVGNAAQADTSEYQQLKEWVSAKDHRVRGNNTKDHASHVALNGVKIDEGDSFVDPVNGDRLQFPGDPKASAASVINCRCVAAYTIKRDENGDPIRKRATTVVQFPSQQRRPAVVRPRRTTVVIQPGQVRRPQTITI
jgi:hypothetical protein